MKIAMLLPSLSRTGPGIVVEDLCSEFVKMGHQCKVFYFDDIVELHMPCEIERINFHKAMDFDNWDIIHAHMLRPNAYIWYHKRKIRKSKTITTLHNPITYKATRTGFGIIYSSLVPPIWRAFVKVHDNIVCLNDNTHFELPKKLKGKSQVIFNGRNIDTERCLLSNNEKDKLKALHEKYKVLGTISSLTRRKGIDQAVKALPLLPDYALLIVGSGPEISNLENLARKLKVDNRIFFLGFKERPVDYLPYFDIFFLTSESEGFPLALIEASAYGKPCVLSDIPILKSIISENNGVKFYKIHNISDFAAKVTTVFNQKDVLGKNINGYYKQVLTSKIMAEKYIEVYKQ